MNWIERSSAGNGPKTTRKVNRKGPASSSVDVFISKQFAPIPKGIQTYDLWPYVTDLHWTSRKVVLKKIRNHIQPESCWPFKRVRKSTLLEGTTTGLNRISISLVIGREWAISNWVKPSKIHRKAYAQWTSLHEERARRNRKKKKNS